MFWVSYILLRWCDLGMWCLKGGWHCKSELNCADQTGFAVLHLAPDLCRVSPYTATLLWLTNWFVPLMKNYLIKWKLLGKWNLAISWAAMMLWLCSTTLSPSLSSLFLISVLCSLWYWIVQHSEWCSNIDLSCKSAWFQATFPVCFGGIGVCRASQFAPSASAAGSYDLINQILPVRLSGIPYLAVDAAVIQWSRGHNYPLLHLHLQTKGMGPPSCAWDIWSAPTGYFDSRSRAKLLAASTKEPGASLSPP